MTITWKIDALDCKPQEGELIDVAITAHWRCNGSQTVGETTFSGTAYGSIALGPVDPNAFTPYDQLTEAQVVAWAKEQLGQDAVDATEANVNAQVATAINPPVVTLPLPWSA
jgi:hypothetical protein